MLKYLLCLSILLLCSCSPANTSLSIAQEYTNRLATVLEVESFSITPPNKNRPTHSQLLKARQSIESINISMAQLQQLQACNVGQLIAERNSTLGKIQQDSIRFIYEIKLVKAIPTCLKQLNHPKAEQLRKWYRIKKSQLANQFINLVLLGDEMRQGIFTTTKSLQPELAFDYLTTFNALNQLLEIQLNIAEGNIEEIDTTKLLFQLRTIKESAIVARVINSQTDYISGLKQLNEWLKVRLIDKSLCKPFNSQRLNYLQNVRELFFINKMQSDATKLTRAIYKLTPVLNQLYFAVEPIHPGLFTQQRLESFKLAFTEHVKIWQNLNTQCNPQL